MTQSNSNDEVDSSDKDNVLTVADAIRTVNQSESAADGEFNQNEYFIALTLLKKAKLSSTNQDDRDAVDAMLADLEDRYGRLGAY